MKLFLVRHGETEWNKLGRFQGQEDTPLNHRGREQARETAIAAVSWQATAIYASPLCRTMETAQAISRLVGLPVAPQDGLKELALGELEGVTGEEMRRGWPQVYQTWREDPGAAVMPGGESLSQLQRRAWQVVSMLEQAHPDDAALVLVSHNFALRAIIAQVLGMPLSNFHRMSLALGSIGVVESDSRGRRLVSYNSTSHLSQENR
ncbi:MAG: histidine phosphatase family protein [Dehalococcoidia bacterium]|nr:histidine phosphatase family protein [Dehalococcoidia bacterium]MSQ16173.1 histidine phosphatase family protein [Dehalococcoidia bacterium]